MSVRMHLSGSLMVSLQLGAHRLISVYRTDFMPDMASRFGPAPLQYIHMCLRMRRAGIVLQSQHRGQGARMRPPN